MLSASEIVEALGLEPHPEGGYFVETYRAKLTLPGAALGPGYAGERSAATAIYYLLTPDSFSALHRVRSDEIFHFYIGGAVEMLQLYPDGSGQLVMLGPDLRRGKALRSSSPAAPGRGRGWPRAPSTRCWARR